MTISATTPRSIAETPVAPPGRRRHSHADIDTWSSQFEGADPREVIEWAVDEFPTHLCLTASFADTLLIDFATKVDPDIEVVFIDTGFHFSETLDTMKKALARYSLNLTVLRPSHLTSDLWATGVDSCCSGRKVIPLDRHLTANSDAWMSGLRRDDSAERADTPIVGLDRRGLVKINPLAAWSSNRLDEYILANDVIINPLAFEGYPSLGCWPCTDPVSEFDDTASTPVDIKRAGRWTGSTKTECGIH